MKFKYFIAVLIILSLSISACKKGKFAEYYADPSTVNTATVEKQFAGSLAATLDYTMYKYWNYFVVLQNTALHYTQVVAWKNFDGQYVPGAAAIGDRWSSYYNFLAQYKEFLKIYNSLPAQDQADKKIYKIAATIFFYDQTQKVVDLHGDIPWSEAGLLSTNGGDYKASYAKYDKADAIYTKMLDDLKSFSDELNTLTVPDGVKGVFKVQDFINKGDVTLWKKYCNSLRIRMLMRVSGATAFQSRAATEIGAILSNPSSYPVCTTVADNIHIKVNSTDGNNPVQSDLRDGLIGWGSNDKANKMMIDTMNNNTDPRIRVMFQPGALAAPNYIGLDPTLDPTAQDVFLNKDTLARYNWSTITRNRKLPGIIITAAEVQLLIADYYNNVATSANDAAAKTAYENGIGASIDYLFWIRSISDNNETAVAALTPAEKTAYITTSNIKWVSAATKARKNELIALQKWINYNVLQPLEGWAEVRRTNLPVFTFRTDNSSSITKQPPVRWFYPDNERTYNTDNYNTVKANDNLSTKLFWDIN